MSLILNQSVLLAKAKFSYCITDAIITYHILLSKINRKSL